MNEHFEAQFLLNGFNSVAHRYCKQATLPKLFMDGLTQPVTRHPTPPLGVSNHGISYLESGLVLDWDAVADLAIS